MRLVAVVNILSKVAGMSRKEMQYMEDGGPYRTRICDLYRVKEAL